MNTTTTHEVLTGICSCCLGRFVVADDGQKPVLHGYKRPGDGVVHGECVGMTFPMYEISTVGCIYMRDRLLDSAKSYRQNAANLRGGKITRIVMIKTKYDRLKGGQVNVEVVLTPESTREEMEMWAYSWPQLCEYQAKKHDREADDLDRRAQEYQAMIDAWKPGMEFISEERLNAEKTEKREALKNARAWARQWKDIWSAIGRAVTEHKAQESYLVEFNTSEMRSTWARMEGGNEKFDAVIAERKAALAIVGPFPTDKARKAARDRAK